MMFDSKSVSQIKQTARTGLPLCQWDGLDLTTRAMLLSHIDALKTSAPSSPELVFYRLVWNMCADQGITCVPEMAQINDALQPIQDLIKAGYFQDHPNAIDSTFWVMAAGEESEREAMFQQAPIAYQELTSILDGLT